MSGVEWDAAIVGGGIAGMACAIRLSERGLRVVLLETRKKLGGRASSFIDPRTGEALDNCQHVVLGCCTNYMDFLERVGTADRILWHDSQTWIEPGGRRSVVKPGLLPAPAHYAGSFARARFLTKGEVASIGRASWAIIRADRGRHEGETFGAFLARAGQSDETVRKFWSPVVISACNLDVDRVSAASALHVFQEGFLARRDAARMGVPTGTLSELYEGVASIVEGAGGAVRLGAAARRVGEDEVELASGETVRARCIVLATPVERVGRLVDPALAKRDGRIEVLGSIGHSPIVGVHLAFEESVLDVPHCVLVGMGTQWLFRKDGGGRRVHAVISAASDWVGLDEDAIVARVLEDMHACLPSSAGVELSWARAVKEKLATFAVVPGFESKRPGPVGRGSRLVLAGDYTDTGWPATMEGATRAGYRAGEAVMEALGESLAPARMSAGRGEGAGLSGGGVVRSRRPAFFPRLLGLS